MGIFVKKDEYYKIITDEYFDSFYYKVWNGKYYTDGDRVFITVNKKEYHQYVSLVKEGKLKSAIESLNADDTVLVIEKLELSSSYTENYNAQLEKKKEKYNNPNLEIEFAASNQLQLDYDFKEIPSQFHEALKFLKIRCKNEKFSWKEQTSASGEHLHVIITMPIEMDVMERIAWQAIFGSDIKRESLNIVSFNEGNKTPVLLFKDTKTIPIEHVVEGAPNRKFKDLCL